MIQANYRQDYAGEFVVLKTRVVNGKKEQTREWIENPIANQHISERAAIIGSTCDHEEFDHRRPASSWRFTEQKTIANLRYRRCLERHAIGFLRQC